MCSGRSVTPRRRGKRHLSLHCRENGSSFTTVAHPTPSRARHATTLTVNPPPQKLAVALACLPVAAAFVAPAPAGASVKVQETKADLEALAVKLNPVVGFYDPLGAVHKSNFAAFRRSTDYELSIYLM